MSYAAKNNAFSTLAAGITDVAVSLTVQAGKGALFDVTTPVYTYATLEDSGGNIEVVKVTARATDTLTIVRAQDGTSARAWNSGDIIECRPCAAAMNDYAVGPQIDTAAAKGTPVDADKVGILDSAASNVLKYVTWANIKATLKTYFDTLYRTLADDLTLLAGKVIIFEGATDDAYETTLTVADPTADRTITLPDKSGTVAMTSDITGSTQIQPISASVGSNALTISASALSLNFRSATLTSGAVTTVSGTPANLVISSGSTLGTINATRSRIAVLAMNNAGTIELAAVNISGGNDLSETGVISTTAEGGAGGADSANVIYSTTARSNLAYRVIGYIESTQATAGTWATAPSTIQGAGGNAVTAMSSLGYGQTWQDVTGSRAAATTYYNTTGRPISVSVTNTSAAGNSTALTVNGVVAANAYISAAAASQVSAVAIVPPGGSYSVAVTGTIGVWAELR